MGLKKFFSVVLVFAGFAVLTGCAEVRTYTVEKDRVDQDLVQGNRGYFTGGPKESDYDPNRKLTRQTYVAEVELGRAPRAKKRTVSQKPVLVETVQEPLSEPIKEETASETVSAGAEKVTSYTVQNNDTLQKISIAVYGTSKKWKKIFEANSDQLKSPDKIFAGQVLKIPQE